MREIIWLTLKVNDISIIWVDELLWRQKMLHQERWWRKRLQ